MEPGDVPGFFLEMVVDLESALKELMVIDRQKSVVRKSLCTEEMKAKLLAQLEAKAKAVQVELDVPPPKQDAPVQGAGATKGR